MLFKRAYGDKGVRSLLLTFKKDRLELPAVLFCRIFVGQDGKFKIIKCFGG